MDKNQEIYYPPIMKALLEIKYKGFVGQEFIPTRDPFKGLSQAAAFEKEVGLTGICVTKLDGTARGGVVVALAKQFPVAIPFVGVGEGIADLRPFKARDFARALVGAPSTE